MNRQLERYLQIIFVAFDICVLNLVFILTQLLLIKTLNDVSGSYFKYLIIVNITWLLLSFFLRGYTIAIIFNFDPFIKRSIQIYIAWIIIILFYLFFSRELTVSRFYIILTISGFGFGLLVNRFLYVGIFKYFSNSAFFAKKVLILGYNETAKKLANYFEQDGHNIQILGFIEDEENILELSHYPVLADIPQTLRIAKELKAQEIFSTITPEQNKDVYELMFESEKECIRFRIVPNLSSFIMREVHIEYYGDLPILSLRKEPLDDVGNRIKKRVLDFTLSLLVTIFILSWLVPIVGLIILLDSGWPIFFKQLRTGKNKKSFYCLKFRSMKPNKDADFKQATRNDNRVTSLGRFLRRTSLDEFPQFFNVLKGEMSLVGPRPHMIKHTTDYSKLVDEYMVRQFIKPGITGWAQINGYRGQITDSEQIKMRVNKDLWYLENWTFWLDIRILFLTIYYIFKGDKKAF